MGDITSKPLSTLRKSENLLGTAKEKGKNCFVYRERELTEHLLRRESQVFLFQS